MPPGVARDQRTTIILNVANGSTLAGLPGDAVVEVPCAVDANGAHPLAVYLDRIPEVAAVLTNP